MRHNYLAIIIILVASLASYLALMYWINPVQGKALVESQSVSPSESLIVSKELQAGQKTQLVIHYPIFGIPLTAKIVDPSGVTVVDINSTSYDRELYAEFQPTSSGKYTLTVTNHGTQATPLHVILDSIEKFSTSNPFK